MTRRLLAVALALAVAAPLPASAFPPPPPDRVMVDGGCGFSAVADRETPGRWTAVVDGQLSAYSPNPARNPVTVVSARCYFWRNGELVADLPFTTAGPVGLLPPTPVTFTADEFAFLETCVRYEVVDALGAREEGFTDCDLSYEIPWWQTWAVDVAGSAYDAVNAVLVEHLDPALCAALRTVTPPPGGVVEIRPDGDVHVAGELVYDCAPYVT